MCFIPVSKSDRWRIGTSIGISVEKLSINGVAEDDYSLWKIRPQLIYHLKHTKEPKPFFL